MATPNTERRMRFRFEAPHGIAAEAEDPEDANEPHLGEGRAFAADGPFQMGAFWSRMGWVILFNECFLWSIDSYKWYLWVVKSIVWL